MKVETGVGQVGENSPVLFPLIVDWIMNKATEEILRSIYGTRPKRWESKAFAEDFGLLGYAAKDIQEKDRHDMPSKH